MRRSPLPLLGPGKTGFTLLPPGQTGLAFTNTLDDGASAANRVLENGSGVAVGDFNGDGWPDIFLCSLQGHPALFQNLGGWRFREVTQRAGLADARLVSRGAVFADIDGDGSLDLLVATHDQGVRCWRNTGRGTFTEITTLAGTGGKPGSTTLALADVDGNGTLDLYVARYRAQDIRDQARVEVRMVNGRLELPEKYRDRLVLTPQGLMEFGEPDILYLNQGQGRFQEVPWTQGFFLDEAGAPMTAPPRDWGLTAAFRDLNGDGYPDLYVCNDYWTPDRLWFNDGHGHLRLADPLALRHTSENSMGVDFADIDGDGLVDFLVLDMLSRDPRLRQRQALAQTRMTAAPGEIQNRPQIMRNTLFLNRGDHTFAEVADYAGLPASEWSWQPFFLDVDLDGWADLLIPAGHRRDIQDLDATLKIKALQHPWPKTMSPEALQQAFTLQMMEHARLYPPLALPVAAFRNQGHLRFEDVTDLWGTEALGVHQGMALADFDRDGDLDFVVNNLNGAAGLYRNESPAPRIAVRLQGRPPNTQAIGARVTLTGATVPRQTQEVVCGGRYLSGSDTLLVFGVGSAPGSLALEIRWPSGRLHQVGGVQPNQLLEIQEPAGSSPAAPAPPAQPPPWFEEVSSRINHHHHENPTDDLARQPLLPRRLGQLGPGVAWFDIDQDGHEDLAIGGGKDGTPAVFLNAGRGLFRAVTNAPFNQALPCDQTSLVGGYDSQGRAWLLAGQARDESGASPASALFQYELGQPGARSIIPGNGSATGPVLLADLDGDGRLELFVAGRLIPGRYPEPASSRIFRKIGGIWQLDEPNTRALAAVGLVSGAVFSDLDGDGFPELILACEWGPIRIFQNHGGRLEDASGQWGIDTYTGLWAGITAGDLDGDGRMDLIASNWGENSAYHASPQHPLRLYHADLMGRGIVDLVEAEFDPARGAYIPRQRLEFLAAGLPLLQERFPSFRAFSEATIQEVLGEALTQTSYREAGLLASKSFLNRGGRLEAFDLPAEAQFAPAFSVNVGDADGDGHEDVFLSQNCFALTGDAQRLDAGRGLWLQGDGTGRLRAVPGQESGIQVYGEQRGAALADFDEDGRVDLAVAQNGAATRLFRNQAARPGLRVRLRGPPGNPAGIGAVIQIGSGGGWGPAREIHGGSGYGSQDGLVQVMSSATTPARVRIRWPGGKVTDSPLPSPAREVTVDTAGTVTVAGVGS